MRSFGFGLSIKVATVFHILQRLSYVVNADSSVNADEAKCVGEKILSSSALIPHLFSTPH